MVPMGGLSMLLKVAVPARSVKSVVPRTVRTAWGDAEGPVVGDDGPPPPQDGMEAATKAARTARTARLSARLFIEHPSCTSRASGPRRNADSSRGGGGDQPRMGSELGREAGGDVGPADVATGG